VIIGKFCSSSASVSLFRGASRPPVFTALINDNIAQSTSGKSPYCASTADLAPHEVSIVQYSSAASGTATATGPAVAILPQAVLPSYTTEAFARRILQYSCSIPISNRSWPAATPLPNSSWSANPDSESSSTKSSIARNTPSSSSSTDSASCQNYQ